MPGRLITDPAEWERITGTPRVRYIIELPPVRPKPMQGTETPKPEPKAED